MSEFDAKANDWDKNNQHMVRAMAIADQLRASIPLGPGMNVMEFGAGTALLSFLFRDEFASVTLIDNSKEMIRICNEKIAETQSVHFRALQLDLETEDLTGSFDLVYSQMAFHHLTDIDKVVRKLNQLLTDKGILAVADLYTEDGSFHGEGFTGHNGFDPQWLASLMRQAGFDNVSYSQCHVQKKAEPDGTFREYPVFLILAKKGG